MGLSNSQLITVVNDLDDLKEQAAKTINPMQKARLAEAGLNSAIKVIQELVQREIQRSEKHG